MAADLSVIIINYNTPELTAGTVESLFATREKLHLEIVVIDNASTRGDLRSALAPWQKRAKESRGEVALQVTFSEKNLGFTGGNNLGLKQATAPVLLMLNSDTRVRPGCLKACLDYLAKHPEAGILGPKLLDPEGTRQLSCRRFPSFRTALFNRYSLLTRLFPRNPWSRDYLMNEPEESDEPRVVDWVSGAAMFITRQAFGKSVPWTRPFSCTPGGTWTIACGRIGRTTKATSSPPEDRAPDRGKTAAAFQNHLGGAPQHVALLL
jgi:GT2 family glycosyltransferase